MFTRNTLKNGIRVVGYNMPYLNSISVGIWVNAGSVKENEKQAGITHFIEHMLFKGTQKRSAVQIANDVDSIGANINAFTSKECTCYYMSAAKDMAENCFEILSDLLINSDLPESEMEKEKGVVVEEIIMGDDTPEDVAYNLLMKASYEGHNLAKPIIGTMESVKGFSKQDLRDYIDEHYFGENIVIAIAGSFDDNELVELSNTYFGSIKAKSGEPGELAAPSRQKKSILTATKEIEQAHIMMSLPGYASNDENFYTLALLSNTLGGSMSSRLFQKIREEKGLVYSIYSFQSANKNCGQLGIYAGTGFTQANEVTQLIIQELDDIKENGISEEELIRSKNQIKGSFLISNESSRARMNAIGRSVLYFDTAQSEEEIISKIESVTLKDIRKVIDNVIDKNALCASFVGKDGTELDKLANLW